MLKRSKFAVDTNYLAKGDDPGYTILIPKHSIYAQTETLKGELDKLVEWARRMMPSGYDWKSSPIVIVRDLPTETHYCRQFARVDIFDPLMQRIEYLVNMKSVNL